MSEGSNIDTEQIVTAGLMIIGDEILSGRTQDKNIAYIADHLTTIGIQLREVRIVPDQEDRIVGAVNAMRHDYSYVFTTGGIGPTHDDITADAIAKAFEVAIDVDPRAVAIMSERYTPERLTEARLRMARIPEGAELIDNPISRTPGFMIGNVIVMAGIPSIMQVMLDAATPMLRTGKKMLSATVQVSAPEGDIAPVLSGVAASFPEVAMGSYPFFRDGQLGVHIVLRALDPAKLEAAETELRSELTQHKLPH